MIRQDTNKKVFVGLSGGVDSAVSAALLKEAGYDVTGVFIEVWQPDWIECNWREDRRDAMRVAATLGIPFVSLDLRDEYKKGVIDYTIEEYRAGRTPNPDVMCNREVKFGAFWKWAKEQGADYVATGHYARVDLNNKTGRYELKKGIDSNKDQSYFLWTLNQDDLKHILFPVGYLEKPRVRELAQKFGLPNFDKKDSQGLCFIGKIDLKEFLAHFIKTKPGKVLDETGHEIGTHPGALFFTIGERHGFNIAKKTPNDRPYYVVSKNMSANTITVSNRELVEPAHIPAQTVRLERTNWVSGEAPLPHRAYEARSRYRQELQPVHTIGGAIEYAHPQSDLSPGQSIVLYDGEVCLGGGIIA